MKLRRVFEGVTVLMLIVAAGCIATKHGVRLTEEARSQVRTVAVVPALFAPRTDYTAAMRPVEDLSSSDTRAETRSFDPPDNRTSSIWKHVHDAAWAEGRNYSHSTLEIVMGILAGSGRSVKLVSIEGKVGVAVSSERNKAIEADIRRGVPLGEAQGGIAELFAEAGRRLTGLSFRTMAGRGPSAPGERPDYRALGNEGVDHVLEVAVNDIGFIAGSEEDPVVSVFVHAGIRVIRVADGTVQYDNVSVTISRKHLLSAWLKDDGKMVRSEIAKAQAEIAARTIEKLFLLNDTAPADENGDACMLAPNYPQAPEMMLGVKKTGLSFPKIDSLQPLFSWEAFPREADKTKDTSSVPPSITDVVYDLRIWQVADGYPDALVYEWTGIPLATRTITRTSEERSASEISVLSRIVQVVEHRLEKQLEPSTEYFWSVRAQFKLNGQPRVTRWSYSRRPWYSSGMTGYIFPDPCRADHIPLMYYYRFRTP